MNFNKLQSPQNQPESNLESKNPKFPRWAKSMITALTISLFSPDTALANPPQIVETQKSPEQITLQANNIEGKDDINKIRAEAIRRITLLPSFSPEDRERLTSEDKKIMREVVEEIFAVDPPSRSVINESYPSADGRGYQGRFAGRTIEEVLSEYEKLKNHINNLDSYNFYQLNEIDNLVRKFEEKTSLLTSRNFRVTSIVNAVDRKLIIPRLSKIESRETIKDPEFLKEVIRRNFQLGRRDTLVGILTLSINNAARATIPKTSSNSDQNFTSSLSFNSFDSGSKIE